MRALINIRCDDGAEYDLLMYGPEDMPGPEAAKIADKAIQQYFASSGEDQVPELLHEQGFILAEIFDTEGAW
jgi:hypothetical protein